MAAQAIPKILLVDDNRDFLQVTGEILRMKAGYDVILLEEGGRTFDVARQEKPDVIMLDVYMPNADGPQICRELKASDDLANIPILFLIVRGRSSQLLNNKKSETHHYKKNQHYGQYRFYSHNHRILSRYAPQMKVLPKEHSIM